MLKKIFFATVFLFQFTSFIFAQQFYCLKQKYRLKILL